jgi:hypothetical protein
MSMLAAYLLNQAAGSDFELPIGSTVFPMLVHLDPSAFSFATLIPVVLLYGAVSLLMQRFLLSEYTPNFCFLKV